MTARRLIAVCAIVTILCVGAIHAGPQSPTFPWKVLPVERGGTGANDATAARAALGISGAADLAGHSVSNATHGCDEIASRAYVDSSTVDWARVSSTPTTLAGYGIVDASSAPGKERAVVTVATNTITTSMSLGAQSKASVGINGIEHSAPDDFTFAGSHTITLAFTVPAGTVILINSY